MNTPSQNNPVDGEKKADLRAKILGGDYQLLDRVLDEREKLMVPVEKKAVTPSAFKQAERGTPRTKVEIARITKEGGYGDDMGELESFTEKLELELAAVTAERDEANGVAARLEKYSMMLIASHAKEFEELHERLAALQQKVEEMKKVLIALRPMTTGTRRAADHATTHKQERFETADTKMIDDVLKL